jgi:hypothetical protein
MKPGDASYPKGRNPLEAEKPVVEHGTTVMVPKIVSYDDRKSVESLGKPQPQSSQVIDQCLCKKKK